MAVVIRVDDVDFPAIPYTGLEIANLRPQFTAAVKANTPELPLMMSTNPD